MIAFYPGGEGRTISNGQNASERKSALEMSASDRLLTRWPPRRSFMQPAHWAGECQMRKLLFAAASLSLFMGAPSIAAPCKDAKGRFSKCPKTPAKPVRCKSANGKFAKCGTAGARPV